MSEYNKDRRPMELEPFYSLHVVAMTREGLHSKSDIAQELAYRDKQIAGLRRDAERWRQACTLKLFPQYMGSMGWQIGEIAEMFDTPELAIDAAIAKHENK